MKKTQTLSFKLALIFSVGLLFGMTASGVTTFIVQNRIVKNLTNQTLKNTVLSSATETEEELIAVEATVNDSKYLVRSYFSTTASLADSSYVADSLAKIAPIYDSQTKDFDCVLDSYIVLNPAYTNLSPSSPEGDGFFHVKDDNGNFVTHPVTNILHYEENDAEHVGWWYAVKNSGKAIWLEPYYNANIDENMFSYIAPVYSSNEEFLGIIGMDFKLESIIYHLSEIKDYTNAYPYLQTQNGKVVYHKDVQTFVDGKYVGSNQSLEDIVGIENLHESSDGAITYKYNGKKRTTMSMTLSNNLTYGISVSASELRKPIRLVTIIPVLAFIGVSIVLVFIFYLLIQRIVKPLKELHQAVDKVQQGDYKLRIDSKSTDEIGDLTRAFNDMLGSLSEKNRMITAMAFLDGLTGVKNKNAQRDMAKILDDRIKNNKAEFAVIMLDVDKLKMINDNLGHEEGDKVIIGSCYTLCKAFSHSKVFRIGGDEFVAIAEGEDYENRQEIYEKLKNHEITVRKQRFEFSVGMATYKPGVDKSFKDVFSRADQEMYLNKKEKRKYE